jgi:hypothetical protein
MKTLTSLLNHRAAILAQARLANLAYAYDTLRRFEHRITRGRLRGSVTVRHAAPEEERYWASLTANEGAQSVLDEHFSDEDVMELADVLSFLTCTNALELTFPLEELSDRFLAPLRAELAREGVGFDPADAHRDVMR